MTICLKDHFLMNAKILKFVKFNLTIKNKNCSKLLEIMRKIQKMSQNLGPMDRQICKFEIIVTQKLYMYIGPWQFASLYTIYVPCLRAC